MASDLWAGAANKRSWSSRATASLERASMRRADACYAPSAFVADHYRQRFKIPVAVLRPPVFIEQPPAKRASVELPERFLIHFGQLGPRKGTDTLAEALPLAWRDEPTLTMVWAGRMTRPEQLREWRAVWGAYAANVVSVGPLARPELFAVLGRAEAAVLPSLADNLPNTVIESLLFGLPVIGSQGASIDELVEDGRTGTLVPLNAPHELARAMVAAWRGQAPWSGKPLPQPTIFEEMEPSQAAKNLIALASRPQHRGAPRPSLGEKRGTRGTAHA